MLWEQAQRVLKPEYALPVLEQVRCASCSMRLMTQSDGACAISIGPSASPGGLVSKISRHCVICNDWGGRWNVAVGFLTIDMWPLGCGPWDVAVGM